ncbi:MAG: alpha/beta hydrolase family protein [Cellvibrionaceae bacterium]
MRKQSNQHFMIFFTLMFFTFFSNSLSANTSSSQIIPMQAWTHDPVISSVNVSPDGNKLVALTIQKTDQAPDITVWQTKDLSKSPVRFAPKDVKALSVFWLSNEQLMVVGRQKFDYRYGGRPTRWFKNKAYIVDTKGKKFREILSSKEKLDAGLMNTLPLEPDNVLVTATNLDYATDIYKLNLKNFIAKRIYRGSPKKDFFNNPLGEVIGESELKGSGEDTRIEFSYINPKTGEMEFHHSLYARKREGMQPIGFDIDGQHVYMMNNLNRDKSALFKYDLNTRKLGEPILASDDFSISGVTFSSNPQNLGQVISYTTDGAKRKTHYVDPVRKQLQKQLDAALPKDQGHKITSMSDDMTVMVVKSTGVKEPGAYYLMVNGKELIALGRSFPNLKPEQLADMKFVTYKARDGLKIPAYLTIPNTGKAPYPTVIMPHGGPWARDFYGFDRWVQFLANRGYAVLQPQYRGSDGWGQKLWRAGDREWGQKMQDDKDDGAEWLVKEGIAAKDRMAIYGYSYGGYAAMAAVVRPNSPYQCAIAGAGLSELATFDKVTFEGKFGREFQNPTIAGLSPIEHVKDANIPIYIFHGDRDQRVPVEQSRKFYKALEKAGKTVEYNEIPDLWHSLPWWPTHHVNVLGSIEDYLANRCGPGGL